MTQFLTEHEHPANTVRTADPEMKCSLLRRKKKRPHGGHHLDNAAVKQANKLFNESCALHCCGLTL